MGRVARVLFWRGKAFGRAGWSKVFNGMVWSGLWTGMVSWGEVGIGEDSGGVGWGKLIYGLERLMEWCGESRCSEMWSGPVRILARQVSVRQGRVLCGSVR